MLYASRTMHMQHAMQHGRCPQVKPSFCRVLTTLLLAAAVLPHLAAHGIVWTVARLSCPRNSLLRLAASPCVSASAITVRRATSSTTSLLAGRSIPAAGAERNDSGDGESFNGGNQASSTASVSGHASATGTMRRWKDPLASSPRAQSCVLMAAAMSLHFGGYEPRVGKKICSNNINNT